MLKLNKNKNPQSKKQHISIKDLPITINLSKEEVKEKYGLAYNDIYCNIWMYHLTSSHTLFKQNYLYLIFKNNRVIKYQLKKFKSKKIYKQNN